MLEQFFDQVAETKRSDDSERAMDRHISPSKPTPHETVTKLYILCKVTSTDPQEVYRGFLLGLSHKANFHKNALSVDNVSRDCLFTPNRYSTATSIKIIS